MRIRVTQLDDGPEELFDQVPFDADLMRQLPGADRPDYWLGALVRPLRWESGGGAASQVTHVILCARLVGEAIAPGMRDTAVNIAFVTDATLLGDRVLDFDKCAYIAIGFADVVST